MLCTAGIGMVSTIFFDMYECIFKKTLGFDPGVISESVRKFSNDSFCSFEWIAAAKVEQSKNWKIYLSLFESCFHFMELKKQRQKIFI